MRSSAEPKEVKVKTVEKTLKLLEILAEYSAPLPLTRLGQISKLSLSTAHRLLNTLCHSGFVERDQATGHYKLGLKAFLVGNAALKNVELRPVALSFMNKLSKQIEESVYLAILSGRDVIYSDAVKTSRPIQIGIQTGLPVPACQTSSGKILLAYLPLTEVQFFLCEYQGKELIADSNRFVEELRQIKENGFASEIAVLGGNIREMSAPIFNHLGVCIGTIGVFHPAYHGLLTDAEQQVMAQVKETAAEISKALGFSRR